MFEYRHDFNHNAGCSKQYSSTISNQAFPFSALTPLIGRQEGYLACYRAACERLLDVPQSGPPTLSSASVMGLAGSREM